MTYESIDGFSTFALAGVPKIQRGGGGGGLARRSKQAAAGVWGQQLYCFCLN